MKRIYINDGWRFHREAENGARGAAGREEAVRLPHANTLLPYNYTAAEEYQFVSIYERTLIAPLSWSGMRVLLTFEGAAHRAEVFLNGKGIAAHACGYTAFTVELTDLLRLGGENGLLVRLDSRESLDQPPFGGRIDYLTYGGLYGEAYLELAGEAFIADVFAATPELDELRADVRLDGRLPEGARLRAALSDEAGQIVFEGEYPAKDMLRIGETIPDVRPWSCDAPNLYTLGLTLAGENGAVIDVKRTRVGFRTARFKADGFYLNGQKQKLRGLNRHQSYPYIGYAAPASLQRFDAEVLRFELGLNLVRTAHYPQSRHFLDRCDEIGLIVFTEIPGWQHIGGEEWKERALENVREMILQNRSHPSIVLWGVRINESQDDDAFYIKTNALAHELDDTRQTSGVRYLEKSSLLEDVYAYNDFSHTGGNPGLRTKRSVTPNPRKGYIVSEYNGHMFPAKAFDSEAHRLDHALRHANVLEAMYEAPDVAGCIGWCMADYNTHADFGSGDGVCYHGVMDMFRNPKLAAAVYRTQAEGEVVLELSSTMDIGEHAASNLGEIYAFTNADAVRLYKAGAYVGEFLPERKRFGHMPHPPVAIDDLIGDLLEKNEGFPKKVADKVRALLLAIAKHGLSGLPLAAKAKAAELILLHGLTFADGARLYDDYVGGWGAQAVTWRFEALQGGEVAAIVERGAARDVALEAGADHTDLREGASYDMALVRIRAVDASGSLLPYFQEPVELFTEGPIEIVGPRIVSLKGGMFGTLVKTVGLVGEGKLTLRTAGAAPASVSFTVR